RQRRALEACGADLTLFEDTDLDILWKNGYRNVRGLRDATREGLMAAGLVPGLVDHILSLKGGVGTSSSAAGGPLLKKVKMALCSLSQLASSTVWQKYAWNPASFTDPAEILEYAAFFGFRPAALLPAVIPPQLAAPEFFPILQAAAQAASPTLDLCPVKHGQLVMAVQRLLVLSSKLYKNEEALQLAFLDWHNKELGLGFMTKSSSRSSGASSQAALRPYHDGMLVADGSNFMVSLLEVKSDTGGGEPLVQSLLYYQKHYRDGAVWEGSTLHRTDTLPSLVLLLEGPRLSFHAVWTLYQNRIAYTPLTPSYYLANEPGATANVWRLVAVLAAYQRAARGLMEHYEALELLDPQRCASMAGLRQAACLVAVDGRQVERPCTLPYCLLDEKLDLKDVSFVGPCLLYAAKQKFQGGAGERAVLIKFVEGRYGQEVHAAWHSVGVAPALYSATPVGGGSMVMVVMEHLRMEDGWTALSEVPRKDRGQQLQAAVRGALSKAHAVQLGCGSAAAHGDVRGPNVLVRTVEGGGSAPEVRIIDFDW
ncbi:hypothetical protein TSOC_010728, partial [Tetrabaena socialis]